MRVLVPGHCYELEQLSGHSGKSACVHKLQFVQQSVLAAPTQKPVDGVMCQEVLRVLIDRLLFLDAQSSCYNNQEILRHFRQALVLFETRALERKTERGDFLPEMPDTGPDGHYIEPEPSQ